MTSTTSPGHWSNWPLVHTQADLEQHWRMLMGPLGFGQTLLWVIVFEPDGRATPLIQQIDDMPDVPTPADVAQLLSFCAEVIEQAVPGGSVAFLRSRPGGATWTDGDRAWGTAVTLAARDARIKVHPFHLANDEDLRVFTVDDIAARVRG